MTLGIFKGPSPADLVSSGDFTNPIIIKESNAGGVNELKLNLRHSILSGDGAEFSADVTVEGVDLSTGSGDESTWIQIAPDNSGVPGTYGAGGAPVLLGNVNLGDVLPFWVKITVPLNNENGARQDLALRATSPATNTLERTVTLITGTYNGNTEFDGANNRIIFSYQDSGDTGEFISPWINMSNATSITGVNYNIQGGLVYISYRTANDASGTNASAWESDTTLLNMAQDYVQVRLSFFGVNATLYSGLTKYLYSGQTFNTLGSKTYGQIPYSSNAGSPLYSDNFSVKYIGYFNALTGGTYNFRCDVDDGIRLYVDDVIRIDQFDGGPQSHNANVSLTQGYHKIEFQHYDGSGGQYIYSYYTPPGNSERAVQASDFVDDRSFNNATSFIYVDNLRIVYNGAFEEDFDITFYIGAATPELISPVNGYQTEEFNPELTAVSAQCDHIQFQMDMVNTFSGDNLVTWEVAATDDVSVTTQSPVFDRPSGVWYWRARAKLEGSYGEWSDYWIFTILPYESRDQYIYFNANNGFDLGDPTQFDKHFYFNVALGMQEISIYLNRHVYLNVNVGTGAGEIIYPLYDRTAVRKTTFDGDGGMFI